MLELKVIKSPTGATQSYEIRQGRSMTLGRAEECQIRLPSTGISKKHCVITPISASRVEVEDLGSANGTYINGLLIKKHIMQPGDTLSVHHFVLQLVKRAPNVDLSQANDTLKNTFLDNEAVIDAQSIKRNESAAEKLDAWLSKNVYPLADRLSSQIDVRLLSISALAIWTLIVTILSLNPFKDLANTQARKESIEVARLYARQIVRLNQRAVIEQRYQDLVSQLDAQRGQTPGLIDAMILDVVNGQILAPTDRLGQPISKDMYYAQVALSKTTEHVSIDEDNKKAYVSLPIRIGTADGNKIVAAAFVEFSYVDGQFTFSNLVEQIVNSLFYALLISGIFLIFIYRWIEGSLNRTAKATEDALREAKTSLQLDIKWPALNRVIQEIGYCLTKAVEGTSDDKRSDVSLGNGEWASAAVRNTIKPAAAFDESLTVVAWNDGMAKIIGIQEQMALGSDISLASRDVAFETAVRELADEARASPWSPASRGIEFSGRPYRISMISGAKHYLLNLDAEES